MTPEAKRKIQLALAALIAVAAIRAGYIVYQRYSERAEEAAQAEKRRLHLWIPTVTSFPRSFIPPT